MNLPKSRISGPGAAAAIGAGLASALFLLLPAQKMAAFAASGATSVPGQVFAALFMGLLAPLPLMIATLGFGWFAGLIALVVGAATVAGTGLMPGIGGVAHAEGAPLFVVLVFIVTLGVPSWLLARLAIFPQPQPIGPIDPAARAPMRPEERLLGVLATIAIGFGILTAGLALALVLYGSGGFDALVDRLAKDLVTAKLELAKGVTPHQAARAIVRGMMPLVAAIQVLILLANLWLAARIAQMSNLLAQPWPDVPANLRLPRPLAPAFAVALGLSFAGGTVGLVGLIVSAGIGAGLVLQGLAVLHAITRGKSWRTPALVLLYLLLPWPICGLIGLLDSAFAFRDRPKKARPPPGPTGPWGAGAQK